MKVLNDIVSQPKITAEYEDRLMKDYGDYFIEKKLKPTAPKMKVMTITEIRLLPLLF